MKLNDISLELDKEFCNLTSFLKKDIVNKVLSSSIEYPTIDKKILLPRDRRIYGYESLIGMSYDYAIRFLYSYKINKNIESPLYDSIGFKLEKNKNKILNDFKIIQSKDKLLGIIDLSFKMSINEVLYRSGKEIKFNDFEKQNIDNIYEEIKKLLKISFQKISEHKNDDLIDFNPNFSYSHIIADGDIIIDDTLIDFKAVSYLNGVNNHINQLVMYSILNEYNNNFNIKKIQIYYPRFDIYPIFELDKIIKDKDSIINLLK